MSELNWPRVPWWLSMTQPKKGKSKKMCFSCGSSRTRCFIPVVYLLKVDGKCGKLQGIGSVVTKAGEQDQEGWEPWKRQVSQLSSKTLKHSMFQLSHVVFFNQKSPTRQRVRLAFHSICLSKTARVGMPFWDRLDLFLPDFELNLW